MCTTLQRLSVLAVALVASVATFASDACIDGIYYNLNAETKEAEVTTQNTTSPFYNTYPTGDLAIPEFITYDNTNYSVTKICSWAFGECTGLTSIVIPNSVTSIGNYAFANCI